MSNCSSPLELPSLSTCISICSQIKQERRIKVNVDKKWLAKSCPPWLVHLYNCLIRICLSCQYHEACLALRMQRSVNGDTQIILAKRLAKCQVHSLPMIIKFGQMEVNFFNLSAAIPHRLFGLTGLPIMTPVLHNDNFEPRHVFLVCIKTFNVPSIFSTSQFVLS